MSNHALIYKIVSAEQWKEAEKKNVFKGAAIDHQDGYIHFSTAQQAAETAEKHFGGQDNLILVAVRTEHLGEKLKWEVSRNDALFPHLYDSLKLEHVVWARPMPLDKNGIHKLPFDPS